MREIVVGFGIDEAGHGQTKGEVISCNYSINPEDLKQGIFRRDFESKEAKLTLPLADSNYFFTIASWRESRRTENNIPMLAKMLVNCGLKDLEKKLKNLDYARSEIIVDPQSEKFMSILPHHLMYLPNTDENDSDWSRRVERDIMKGTRVTRAIISLDGFFQEADRVFLKETISQSFPSIEIEVDCYKKGDRGHGKKGAFVKCPRVLYFADLRSKALFADTFENLTKHSRYVVPSVDDYRVQSMRLKEFRARFTPISQIKIRPKYINRPGR
jgi:hypothetical protein